MEEKGRAEARYERALTEGRSGGLLQEAGAPDVLRLDVGRLRQGATATAVLTLAMELLPDGGCGRRLECPILVNPNRYPLVPSGDEDKVSALLSLLCGPLR